MRYSYEQQQQTIEESSPSCPSFREDLMKSYEFCLLKSPHCWKITVLSALIHPIIFFFIHLLCKIGAGK